jgi:hypothetical protein
MLKDPVRSATNRSRRVSGIMEKQKKRETVVVSLFGLGVD